MTEAVTARIFLFLAVGARGFIAWITNGTLDTHALVACKMFQPPWH